MSLKKRRRNALAGSAVEKSFSMIDIRDFFIEDPKAERINNSSSNLKCNTPGLRA